MEQHIHRPQTRPFFCNFCLQLSNDIAVHPRYCFTFFTIVDEHNFLTIPKKQSPSSSRPMKPSSPSSEQLHPSHSTVLTAPLPQGYNDESKFRQQSWKMFIQMRFWWAKRTHLPFLPKTLTWTDINDGVKQRSTFQSMYNGSTKIVWAGNAILILKLRTFQTTYVGPTQIFMQKRAARNY